ncbi:MBOAT family protein [Leptothrix ochracea]|uniref:MBOAT family O-acyltransferase n=1 Tax=Leptothrix ochracea TaxID=735331 RepID=UPI0034E2AEB3
MESLADHGAARVIRKRYLVLSVTANLLLLGFFKYFNFFTASATSLAHRLGWEVSVGTLEIILPVAISFYTFQAMSYTIDVYRGKLHSTRSFWDFFLAVLYFPHLVAGPIQRASSLLPQVTQPRTIRADQVWEGLHLIAWGYFKKVFIADNLSPIVNAAFASPEPSTAMTVLGVYAFTFQIYGDFSGYTDIARGIAKIMGFEFVLNFNLPYFATHPADFWRRWHISLSSWLRDYLYKPLGGSRGGAWLTYRNLMITMLLGGLWHGAAWNFVLWGFYHGAIQALHRMLEPGLRRLGLGFAALPSLWLGLRISAMFLLTCYGWLLFRATSLDQIGQMTLTLLHPSGGLDGAGMAKVSWIIAPLVLVQLVQWRSGDLFFMRQAWLPKPLRVVVYALMLYLTVFLGGQPQSFVYFQF